MELINENIIINSENIEFNINVLKLEKKIFINKNIWYPCIVNNENLYYIHYRDDSNINKKEKPDHETSKRYLINNIFDIKDDESFNLNLGIASHNLRLFNLNNKLYGIGGQAFSIHNYNEFKNTNVIKYIEFNEKNNILINSNDYNVNDLIGNKIFNPDIYCPYYANGLYLFELNDKNLNINELNDKLPIISGIKNGRHDGHYGYSNNKNNGITVFDSPTNLLYNDKEKKYFLYQRSNFETGIRHIQYCSSNDLLEWSDFNLIEYIPSINLLENNIYHGNFFKLDGVNNYIGIIPFNKKINSNYDGLDENGYFKLYYSNDCVKWNYIGLLDTFLYYKLWMVMGKPILLNNNYYFYFHDVNEKTIIIKSLEKNRLSYAKSIENQFANILFKQTFIKNNEIVINFKTYNGFIKMQLLDINKNIIDNYSFDNFDPIYDNRNEFNFIVSWNKNTHINIETEVYIEISGVNFELFSITV
jgi:hypothetical protein